MTGYNNLKQGMRLGAVFFDFETSSMTEVAKNGNEWLHVIAKNGNKQNDLQLYRETKSLFLPFLAIFRIFISNNAVQKLPKMAIFIDLKVATNGNYLPHGRSGQKWQFLLTSKLPQMATTCFMTEVAKNGNEWLHVIAKNGNKQNDLQLYRELTTTQRLQCCTHAHT